MLVLGLASIYFQLAFVMGESFFAPKAAPQLLAAVMCYPANTENSTLTLKINGYKNVQLKINMYF